MSKQRGLEAGESALKQNGHGGTGQGKGGDPGQCWRALPPVCLLKQVFPPLAPPPPLRTRTHEGWRPEMIDNFIVLIKRSSWLGDHDGAVVSTLQQQYLTMWSLIATIVAGLSILLT
jgi:hypothetical protein